MKNRKKSTRQKTKDKIIYYFIVNLWWVAW